MILVKKLAKKIKNILIINIILALVLYIIYVVYILIKNPTNICVIKNGYVYEEETAIGYVIRNEVVIKSDNEVIPIIQEGEKVAKDSSIFKISNDNETDLKQKIEDIKVKVQEIIYQGEKFPSSDIDLIEEDIDKKVNKIRETKNYKELQEYKKEINKLLDNKMEIIEKLETSNNEIKYLIKQKEEYEKQLNQNSQNVNSTISGIVSYRVDGLEEKLKPEDFQNITSEYLNSLNLTTGQIVSTSDTQGKIINNFECYIAVVTNTDEARNAKVGDSIYVRLSDNHVIDASIEHIINEENSVVIILKINQQVESLSNYRKISLDVIWWEKEGLRVPNTSIIFENGLSYVVRKKSGMLDKILVKIVKENEKHSIVTNYTTEELKNMNYSGAQITAIKKISIYDEILSDPDLEELKKELN